MTPLPIKPLIDSMLGRVALLEQRPIPRPLLCKLARTATLEKGGAGVYNRLYRNNRYGTFTDVTERVSLVKPYVFATKPTVSVE
jgi:hypothetical protein